MHNKQTKWGGDPSSTSGKYFPDDLIVDQHVHRVIERAKEGMTKYGQSMEFAEGDAVYWVEHAIEEVLDQVNYLLKLRSILVAQKCGRKCVCPIS